MFRSRSWLVRCAAQRQLRALPLLKRQHQRAVLVKCTDEAHVERELVADPSARHVSGLVVEKRKQEKRGPGNALRFRACEVMPWGMRVVSAPAYRSRRRISGVNSDVFVFDTGVDLRNPDLRIARAMSFVNYEPFAQDMNGHGTAVCGVIGALDNGRGVVGIAPGVRIHSMKVLDAEGNGTMADILRGIDHMIWWKRRRDWRFRKWRRTPNNVIANFSLGAFVGSAQYTLLDEAIRRAVSFGITCVVAAGNESLDASLVTPAHCREAICVGSYEASLNFSWWSNFGETVNILAPGGNVRTTLNSMGRRQILSQSISGTSFACPHVAGAAALHAARNPFQSPAQTLARIMALARRHKITIQDVPQATTNLSLSARWL